MVDFTTASDRQIAKAFKAQGNLCGRFRNDQLERDLIIPKEKNSLWMAASAAVVSFFVLGSGSTYAQPKPKIERGVKKAAFRNQQPLHNNSFTIMGVVVDSLNIPVPGAYIKILNTSIFTETDTKGRFTMVVNKGDIIECSFVGYKSKKLIIETTMPLNITMEDENLLLINSSQECVTVMTVTGTGAIRRRTFFGRILHSIGSIFR